MNIETLTEKENASIRSFVESCSEHFSGRVIDYGCGAQPYKDIVIAAGGQYEGYDSKRFPCNRAGNVGSPPSGDYDAILCTQVVVFVPDVPELLTLFKGILEHNAGSLVITWPTNWPEVNEEDLHRFSANGMRYFLGEAGFTVDRVEKRWSYDFGGFELAFGYGAVALA